MLKERIAEAHDIFMSEGKRESRVVNALDSLKADGRIEATEPEIMARIARLRLLRNALGQSGINRYHHALTNLVEHRRIMRVEIIGAKLHGRKVDSDRTAFHIIDKNATPPYLQETKHHVGLFTI